MTIFQCLVLIFGLCIYFAPTILAVANKNKHSLAIFAANLLLGWTVVFWVACAIWALMNQRGAAHG